MLSRFELCFRSIRNLLREKKENKDILKRHSKWNSVIVHYIHNIHLKISYRREFSDYFYRKIIIYTENFSIYIYIYISENICVDTFAKCEVGISFV